MKVGWQKKPLADVCTLINGRAYKKDELLETGKYPVLRVGNFFTNNHWYHSDLELDVDKYCDNGDLLYAWSASFGPQIWDGGKVIYHYHIWKVLPNPKLVDKKFLFRLLEWDVDQIKLAHGTGTTMMHVSKGSMDSRIVPIPPIIEQQRIVTILDEAFAGIATATANAEKNLANARALFESYLQSVLTNKGEGWETKRLGDVCSLLNRGVSPKYLEQDGICVLNQKCIRDHRVSYEQSRRHDQEAKPVNQSRLIQLGDGLVNSTGTGTLGRVAQVRDAPDEPTTVDSHVTIVRPKPDKFFLDFFGYMLVFIEEKIKEAGEGCGGQTELARSVLAEKFTVSYPISLSEQQHIVNKLDELSMETKKLEDIYQKKIISLNELKKSILNQAFSGKL